MGRIVQALKRRFNKILKVWQYRNKAGEVILIDTPEHGNLGDQAIILAEQQLLEEEDISYVEITAMEVNMIEKLYAKLTPINCNIMIHGGGFLGNLWPDEEYRFRRILKAFKNHRIIVFPQTVTFDMKSEEGIEFFKESKKIYSSHKNLTICVREKMSLEFMNTYMPEVEVVLCPDIVTLLRWKNTMYDRKGILLCMRGDKEKALSEESKESIIEVLKRYYPEEKLIYSDTVISKRINSTERSFEVNRKLEEFAKSKVVVTDRLHGMIFAAITGTPCIAFGNSNGKVKSVFEWVKELSYIYFVNNVDEMNEIIKKINIDLQCSYNRKLFDDKFEKLYELL